MDIRRGTVKSFSASTYKATVEVAGSLSVWLHGVPVARNIPAAEMVAGRSCAIVFFEPSNPSDAVVVAVYV